jgi:hypothetical protein
MSSFKGTVTASGKGTDKIDAFINTYIKDAQRKKKY